MTHLLSDLLSTLISTLQWRVPLSGSQVSCLFVDFLPHHTLPSVYLAVLCQASHKMLDCLLALQRIYIWQSFLFALILLYTDLIAQYFTDYIIFNTIELFSVTCRASIIDFGNNVLKFWMALDYPQPQYQFCVLCASFFDQYLTLIW